MSIMERLERDMVQAVKARDAERLGVIRLVRAEAKNLEIELGRKLDDDDAIQVLSRLAKRYRESIEQFTEGGRNDLVERERAQLAVVEEYLPEKLSADEIADLITATIEETGAGGPRGVGLVMKALMPKVKGRADGKAVKDLVLARLSTSTDDD
jgi:uncharacterized protein YqeY